jgi:hypothetical protein
MSSYPKTYAFDTIQSASHHFLYLADLGKEDARPTRFDKEPCVFS